MRRVATHLEGLGLPRGQAQRLASAWIRNDDYLLCAGQQPTVDFVIGNPPYIRYDDLHAQALKVYRSLYR